MRTSLDDVSGILDPLLSYNFDLFFPRIPGVNGDSRGLTLKCMSTSLPGMQVEQQTTGLHGVEVSHAGRQIWNKSFQATFLEARDAQSRAQIRQWMQYARSNRNNRGNFKNGPAGYAVQLVMQLYDDIPNVINTSTIFGCFPTQLDDVAMNGAEGSVVQVSVTFSFDYTEETVAPG